MKLIKMFNKQKKPDKILELLTEQADRQEQQMEKINSVENMVRKIQTKQSKQEDVLEEIFDTIEEHTESFEKKENIRGKEKSIINLLISYDEVMGQVFKYTEQYEGTRELHQQIGVNMKIMKQAMQTVGISKIDESQVPVDYSLHELIDTVDTDDSNRKDIINQVVIPGWTYEDRIVRKANVIAYKYREE